MEIFPIPWQQTLQGCRLAIENAERLAEDSRILREKNRLQSAYSVSLDAWEELGKAVLLFKYYKEKEDVSENDWRKILRDHRHKRVAWVHNIDLLYPSTTESTPKSILQLKAEMYKAIKEDGWDNWFNLEREVGVYVDWLGQKGQWRSPCRISKEWFSFPFDSNYWAINVIGQCRQFRRVLSP